MIEGIIKIYLSHKEPEFKGDILWLRPYLDREGYDLLYYGANGWTPLCLCNKGNNENLNEIPGITSSPCDNE